jgi:hypothetical protein
MNESKACRDLFTLLKFDIKGLINPSTIKRRSLTSGGINMNSVAYSLTKNMLKLKTTCYNAIILLAAHRVPPLLGTPHSTDYWETQPTQKWMSLVSTELSLIITFQFAPLQLRFKDVPLYMTAPRANISECTFSRAVGGLR